MYAAGTKGTVLREECPEFGVLFIRGPTILRISMFAAFRYVSCVLHMCRYSSD